MLKSTSENAIENVNQKCCTYFFCDLFNEFELYVIVIKHNNIFFLFMCDYDIIEKDRYIQITYIFHKQNEDYTNASAY